MEAIKKKVFYWIQVIIVLGCLDLAICRYRYNSQISFNITKVKNDAIIDYGIHNCQEIQNISSIEDEDHPCKKICNLTDRLVDIRIMYSLRLQHPVSYIFSNLYDQLREDEHKSKMFKIKSKSCELKLHSLDKTNKLITIISILLAIFGVYMLISLFFQKVEEQKQRQKDKKK